MTRVWRCGNRGNVASVLIEKPARGDFLPILDGGYSLQYSPLMEYREGKGMVLFCQMDVTGRTESDPAAERLAAEHPRVRRRPGSRRRGARPSTPASRPARRHLETAGVAVGSYEGGKLSADQVLVVGPGGGRNTGRPARRPSPTWLKAGGHLLAIGLDEAEANAFLPFKVTHEEGRAHRRLLRAARHGFAAGGRRPGRRAQPRSARAAPGVRRGARSSATACWPRPEGATSSSASSCPGSSTTRKQYNLKRTYRRASFLVARLLANMGVAGSTPLLARFSSPVDGGQAGEALAGRPVPRPARGMGRSLPVLPLVRR